MSLKILYITQEITPFLPETNMSVICRRLPQAIQEKRKEIRTFLPRYGCINERRNQLHEVIRLSGMNIVINDVDFPLQIKVASVQTARMQFYFIDNDIHFSRKFQFKDNNGNEFEDNDERSLFFIRGIIETIKKLSWKPDIIHCHGWFSAFAPYMFKKVYNNNPLFYDNPKVIFSVYNDIFGNPLNKKLANKIATNAKPEDVEILLDPTWENVNKFAIQYSDAVVFAEDNINQNLKNFAENNNKHILLNVPIDQFNIYNDFYEKLHENKYL